MISYKNGQLNHTYYSKPSLYKRLKRSKSEVKTLKIKRNVTSKVL